MVHHSVVHDDPRKPTTAALHAASLVQQLSSLAQQQPGCPSDAATSLLTLMLAGGQYGDDKPALDSATTALLFDSLGPQLQVTANVHYVLQTMCTFCVFPHIRTQSLIDTLATAVADPASAPPPGAVERAIAKASELQAATDRLAVVALQPPSGAPKAEPLEGLPSLPSRPSKAPAPAQDASVLAPLVMNQHMSSEWQVRHAACHAICCNVCTRLPQREKESLLAEVSRLQAHREWADSKIDQLISKAKKEQWPLLSETARLKDEVAALRREKDGLEGKLREFERSLQKLKDTTFKEAAAKQDYERRVQAAEAEVKGLMLRDSVRLCVKCEGRCLCWTRVRCACRMC